MALSASPKTTGLHKLIADITGKNSEDSSIYLPQEQFTLLMFLLVVDCVNCMKKTYIDTSIPITDDNVSLHRFSAKLEQALESGRKSTFLLFSPLFSPTLY